MIFSKSLFSYNLYYLRSFKTPNRQCATAFELRDVLVKKIPVQREKVKKFRKSHGSVVMSNVSVDKLYTGMKGINALICETSELDNEEGVLFRGYTIPEIKELLPKAKGKEEPLPEGLFWLMITGDIPTNEQVAALSRELAGRAAIPPHVASMLKSFPKTLHPMTQFSTAITALSTESKFSKVFREIRKDTYWEYYYEDAMDLIAKLPVIAAKIYCHTFKNNRSLGAIDPNKDWSANLVNMLGFDNEDFVEVMRLFLTLHCDHDGGNVSAHTVHLVASALSDPFVSFAAGMNGLAGPLHGLGSQQVLIFLLKIRKELGENIPDQKLREYVWKTVQEGHIIPGYSHPALLITDPRFSCFRDFALKHFPDDPMFKLVSQLFKVVPGILQETHQVKNPWPTIDAHSGIMLYHYGMTEMTFYTVLFGVSRSLGTMANLVWDKALGLPLERPRSVSTNNLEKEVKGKQNTLV